MPPLTKQNKKQEANFGVQFRHYIESNPLPVGSYELKDTRGKDYLAFDEVGHSQLVYGMRIQGEKGAFIRVQGVSGEPDYVYLRLCDAYIVIRYPDCFAVISVDRFIREKESSKRKSLTSTRAKEIAWKVV